MSRVKPNYREILRLSYKGLSQQDIATSVGSSKKTVNRILRPAKERNVSWPLPKSQTNDELAKIFFTPAIETATSRPMPDLEHMHKELKRNGVNKKLLWREYIECLYQGIELAYLTACEVYSEFTDFIFRAFY